MHSGETIDVRAPFWAFPGAHGHVYSAVETPGNDNGKRGSDAGGGAAAERTSNNNEEVDAIEHQPDGIMDVDDGGTCSDVGFGGLVAQEEEEEEHIADNVDGFLEDFLALGGGGGDGDIAEEDLNWLEDMDPAAFLPSTAAVAAAFGDAAADRDDPLPSPPVHEEIEPPVPAVAVAAEGGPTSTPAPAVAAVGVTLSLAETTPPAGPDASGMNDNEGQQGTPAIRVTAVAGTRFDGSAGGGAGAASRKEQLRRQKVARYLDKKKRRRWSKASSYQSRQRVANTRPRHKGRFLPLESEFLPIAELQRRQRALVTEMRDKAAALATAVRPGAP